MDPLAEGLLRTLCFHDSWGYAPTRVELFNGWDGGERPNPSLSPLVKGRTEVAFEELLSAGKIIERRGRVVLSGRESLVDEHEQREALFPRKIRSARSVARWLARIDGVRFVALCNTTALANARDEGDLDFFVIARAGTVWQTRAWATLPFKLMGSRPKAGEEQRDAVCLSFFVDDASLDLSSCQLAGDDVYFRHWFLSLLPLYDDGVSSELWAANKILLARHPFARPWIVNQDLEVKRPSLRVPTPSMLEVRARALQQKAFPSSIVSLMNKDSRVLANDHVLKFHVDDGRERYRDIYRAQCERYAIAA